MQALVYLGNRGFEWQDKPAPRLLSDLDVLVRPIGVSTCDLDSAIAAGAMDFAATDYVVGHEFVAEIVEIGDGVVDRSVGDAVIVPFQISCGDCAPCRIGRTAACARTGPFDLYGLPGGSATWGGAMSDLVRVPWADRLTYLLPESFGPEAAGLSDNVSDGWRTIGPYLDQVDSPILIRGAASIGLYAVLFAVSAGVTVHYRDDDAARLDAAKDLGAHVSEGPVSSSTKDRYFLSVNTSSTPDALLAAIASTEDGGICVSTGLHQRPTQTPLPLLDMYMRSIRFVNESVQSRANLSQVVAAIERYDVDFAQLTARTVPWRDAQAAWTGLNQKTLLTRSRTFADKTQRSSCLSTETGTRL